MKDKRNSEVIYALADYRQLVLAYKTKYSELAASRSFWRTSAIWLAVFALFLVLLIMFGFLGNIKASVNNKKSEELLNAKVSAVSEKLSRIEGELAGTREELRKKEEEVKDLEKNISTNSKKMLEKLLVEPEESPAVK